MQLILASRSPYRRAQLENLGVEFTAVEPLADEAGLKTTGPKEAFELTRFLAFQKAESLRARFPQAVILGSDQIAEIDGRRLDKPGSKARAAEQLTLMQARTHRLVTSLCVIAPAQIQTFSDITTIKLRSLSAGEIARYIEIDEPMDCAGSYKIEKAGMALVESIDSRDPSAIQGLPLLSLGEAFKKLGLSWTDLWRQGGKP